MIGVGHSPRHAPHLFLKPFTRVIEAGAQTRNLLTAALQLAHVACGRLDATWDPYLLPWDVLAGILLVKEAGGAAAPYRLRPWVTDRTESQARATQQGYRHPARTGKVANTTARRLRA